MTTSYQPRLRPATPADAEELAVLAERTFVETFIDGFRIPYPADDLAAFKADVFSLEATRARLADEAPGANVAVSMRRLSTPSRLGPMLLAMDDAGKQYRRALEVSPDDREATLRLGRVALERDRLDEAERVLTPLLPGACRDAICGLAHLFMGEIHEARSQPDRAASAYARASAVPALRHTALVVAHLHWRLQASQGQRAVAHRQFVVDVPGTAGGHRGNHHGEDGQTAFHDASLLLCGHSAQHCGRRH